MVLWECGICTVCLPFSCYLTEGMGWILLYNLTKRTADNKTKNREGISISYLRKLPEVGGDPILSRFLLVKVNTTGVVGFLSKMDSIFHLAELDSVATLSWNSSRLSVVYSWTLFLSHQLQKFSLYPKQGNQWHMYVKKREWRTRLVGFQCKIMQKHPEVVIHQAYSISHYGLLSSENIEVAAMNWLCYYPREFHMRKRNTNLWIMKSCFLVGQEGSSPPELHGPDFSPQSLSNRPMRATGLPNSIGITLTGIDHLGREYIFSYSCEYRFKYFSPWIAI